MSKPVVFNGVPLDAPCPECQGKGTTPTGWSYFRQEAKDETCGVCHGCGHLPTEEGKKLLIFVNYRHHKGGGFLSNQQPT